MYCLYFSKTSGLMSTNLPFFFSTRFFTATLPFLKAGLFRAYSVYLFITRVEGVCSLRLGVSSGLVLIGGNRVTVFVCD